MAIARDICPACQRFVGPVLECPYCGLDAPQRPLKRILRLTAFILSTVGLTALFLIGTP